MKKKIIIIFAALIIFSIMLVFFSNLLNNKRIDKELMSLKATAYSMNDFDMYALDSIPKPLRNYISEVLQKNYKYHRMAELEYSGVFQRDYKESQMDVEGIMYFGSYQPGFLEVENIIPFPLTWISSRSYYIEGKGNILNKTMSVLTSESYRGEVINESGLIKYISMAPLYPWIFLNRGIFEYVSFDSSQIKVKTRDKDVKTEAMILLKNNRIYEIHVVNNFMKDKGNYTPTNQIIRFSNYKKINNIEIPLNIDFVWMDGYREFTDRKLTIIKYKYY